MADNYRIDVTLEEVFGTGVESIEQTGTSTQSGGTNEVTATLTNGKQSKFYIKNGERGADGGYPITVNRAADMTNTDAIYLYYGNEQGYTYGYSYFFDGIGWSALSKYGGTGDMPVVEEPTAPIMGDNIAIYLLPEVYTVLAGTHWEVIDLYYSNVRPYDPSKLNRYFFRFTAGENPVTLTLPNGVTYPSDLEIKSGSTYDIIIYNNAGYIWEDGNAVGATGKDGADGVSPTVEMTKTGDVTTLTITDADGEHTTTISDGVRPTVNTASSAADMSDTDLVYVYVGTTTSSLTNGHWYFYDGNDWTDGGAYQSAGIVTDTTLSQTGMAADAKKVGDEISNLNSAIQDAGIPYNVKQAIKALLNDAAYADEDGHSSEKAVITAWADSLDVVSISAVYTQSGTVYDCDSLESLKSDLVVTATFSDSSTSVITAYALSGTLAEGTSTIGVSYEGKTTSFTVSDVEHALFNLTTPFVSTGTEYIDTGVALEADSEISIECTFNISSFSTNSSSSGTNNGVIYGDMKGETSNYTALQEQQFTSSTKAGTYVWGAGLSWADSKNFVSVNQTIKFLITMDIGTTGWTRNWYIKNTSAGTSLNNSQTRTTMDAIKGYNFFIGKQETSSGVHGFNGTVSEFRIFDRILTSEEITDYLGA